MLWGKAFGLRLASALSGLRWSEAGQEDCPRQVNDQDYGPIAVHCAMTLLKGLRLDRAPCPRDTQFGRAPRRQHLATVCRIVCLDIPIPILDVGNTSNDQNVQLRATTPGTLNTANFHVKNPTPSPTVLSPIDRVVENLQLKHTALQAATPITPSPTVLQMQIPTPTPARSDEVLTRARRAMPLTGDERNQTYGALTVVEPDGLKRCTWPGCMHRGYADLAKHRYWEHPLFDKTVLDMALYSFVHRFTTIHHIRHVIERPVCRLPTGILTPIL